MSDNEDLKIQPPIKSKKKTKAKVTLSIDRKVWAEFQIHCIKKYSKIKHASSLIEDLIREHLKNENKKLPSQI